MLEFIYLLILYKTEQDNYIYQHVFTYGYSLVNNLLIESITKLNVKQNNILK